MKLFKIAGMVGLVVLTGVSSCVNDKPAPAVCVADAKDSVSFKNDILPIFNSQCNQPGCHAGSRPAGNLSLEPALAYTRLTKKGSGYIDTLHPESSILYLQMNATALPMPPSGRLDDCTLQTMLLWIKQKAKNN